MSDNIGNKNPQGTMVTDLSFFTELDGFFSFFKLIDWLKID